ncbi:MAG TPA: NHL repeat-containing protein, partial [Anaerolineae bacterium]|nr:NHL repeat-containing protein [Anaerolineae bacterium]
SDGYIYVADGIDNHRIAKFDSTGKFVMNIGGSSGEESPNPPAGLFREPWDVAAAPDGSIYVADTWNHRTQHFKADGTFIRAWGTYSNTGGQAVGSEGGFFGPRGIAIDATGRVLVADTGNKRIQIFEANGQFISQFGGAGLLAGNLDEPVGIAVDVKGNIIVADTWNGRIQVFDQTGLPLAQWDIDGWLDRDLVGKPYVAVDQQQRVYVADEVGRRVLVFDETGTYLGGFGGFGLDNKGFQLPGGIAVDKDGFIYVVDSDSSRVLKFPPFQVKQ